MHEANACTGRMFGKGWNQVYEPQPETQTCPSTIAMIGALSLHPLRLTSLLYLWPHRWDLMSYFPHSWICLLLPTTVQSVLPTLGPSLLYPLGHSLHCSPTCSLNLPLPDPAPTFSLLKPLS